MNSIMEITLGIAGLATLLLITGWVRADVVGLLVAAALAVSGVLTPAQSLAGFGNPVVVVLLAIFILTKGLEVAGVTDVLGKRLARLANGSEARFITVTMLAAAFLSLFMNTIAAGAVLLPPVVAVARREKGFSLGRVLMPMAFGTLLGGTATLLTTANLVTSATLEAHGYAAFGLLDFLPVGLPVTLTGLLYMLLIGRRLLPNVVARRKKPSSGQVLTELNQTYRLMSSLHSMRVGADSPLVGRPANRPGLARDLGLTPIGMVKEDEILLLTRIPDDWRVRAGDIWLSAGQVTEQKMTKYALESVQQGDPYAMFHRRAAIAEVTLNPRGHSVGQTPQALHLREYFGVLVMMIWRAGQLVTTDVYETPLQSGDAFLLYGPPEGICRIIESEDFILMEQTGINHSNNRRKTILAGLGMVIALLPAALGWFPLAISALLGVVFLFLTDVLKPDQAYQAVAWQVIFLIAGMIPLALAMQQTGAAAFLSQRMLSPLGIAAAPWAVAAVFMAITILLAQIISGQAAALMLAPLAIAAAEQYAIEPRGLAMAVAVSASLAFLLPTGHPVNLMVMGPGGYRPKDYFRVGLPLTLILIPVILLALQVFWLR